MKIRNKSIMVSYFINLLSLIQQTATKTEMSIYFIYYLNFICKLITYVGLSKGVYSLSIHE